MHDRDWPIAYDFIAIQAPGPYCMGVGSKDSVPAGFPKKKVGQPPGGSKGFHPLARLCLLSSCEERRWPSGQT